MSDITKISTPRGEARSMTDFSASNLGGPGYPIDAPGDGSDFFSPLAPMRPVAPGVAGRQWDFPSGYNLQIEPRAYEPVDFRALKNLANYDIIRLIIERRKDQLCRVPWTVRIKHEGKKRPKAEHLSPAMRATIRDVEQFFRHPSQGLTFRTWLKGLVEDLLVLDQPAIYLSRSAEGDLVSLDLLDGSTLKPIINYFGRQQTPIRWDGSTIQWLGQTVTPANFEAFGFRIADGMLYFPIWQQRLKGMPAVGYSEWSALVRPMNPRPDSPYGRSPVENIVLTIATAMRRAMSQFEYFREGNQPDAIYSLPETWSPDNVQKFQDYWDSLLSGNLANRRKLKFIPSGKSSAYVPTKEPPLKSEFDEWITRICCASLAYPPSALVELSNRSISESHEKQAKEEGLEPIKAWFCEFANEIVERDFSDEIEFSWNEEPEVDPVKQKDVLVGYVESGIMSLNEAREQLGLDIDPNPAASKLAAMTATGYVAVGDTPPEPTKPMEDDLDDSQRN